MELTLNELIEVLTEIAGEERDDEMKVRIATQPSYPLANIANIVTVIKTEEGSVVWIGTQQDGEAPYAPQQAWAGDTIDLTD